MTSQQLALFGAWILVLGVIWVAIFWAIPILARLRFVTRLDVLRDECMDLVLDGALPMSEPVVDFIRVQDTLINASKHLTIGRLSATARGLTNAGARVKREQISLRHLTPDQRQIMHRMQKESVEVVADLLRQGSPLGWVSYLVAPSVRLRCRNGMSEAQDLADKVFTGATEQVEQRFHPTSRSRHTRPPQMLLT